MPRLALCAFFLSLAICRSDGRAAAGPADALCDRPTSVVSLADRLVFYQEWPEGDTTERRYLTIVPPRRELRVEVLEADVAPYGRTGQKPTTGPLARPVEWLNKQKRARMFGSKHVAYFRHYKVVEIRVSPIFKFGNETYAAKRLRWAYRWRPPCKCEIPGGDRAARRSDFGFGALLSRIVVNPDALGLYADRAPPPGDLKSNPDGLTFARLAGGKRPLLRLDVDKKGLYRLDLRSLASLLGRRLLRLEHMQLYNSGRPVPLYLHRNPAQPDRPDELIFYGVPSDSKYTRTNRYWLVEDPSLKPVRMETATLDRAWRSLPPEKSFPEALVIEQDNDLIIHADNFLTISEFRWVWGEIPPADKVETAARIMAEGPEDKAWFTSATFALPGMAEPRGRTRFEVSFYYSATRLSRPVVVQVRINGGEPRRMTLQNPEDLTQSFELGNDLLNETSNTIEVRFAPGRLPRGESVYFDRIVARYRRRFEATGHGFTFSSDPPTTSGWRHYALRGDLPERPLVLDVADPTHPRVIECERDSQGVLHFGQKETRRALYRILSLDEIATPTAVTLAGLENVAAQSEPVDYLIVSHRDFIDLLDPLVEVLREAGLAVRVVDVENVYASFSWGLSSPLAVKEFLGYTLRNWPGGGPGYVLFVGDCTSDYRGDFRNKVTNFVPSYTLERGPRAEKWASEHWFTTLCGKDEYSDIILGRLSVNNRKDAKTVIDKIVRYRAEPLFGPWRMTVAYVADRGAFDADAERLRHSYKSPALVGRRIYLDELPWEDNFYLPKEIVEADKAKVSPVTTTRILEMLNRGAVFVSYRGHGSPNIWSNERIWFGGDSPNSDILLLRNGPRLPFIVNLTCNSGAIDYPDPPWNVCISEDFMRSPTGGAIGLFVPTGPGVPTTHMRLSEQLHHVIFRENVRALGDIVTLTKWRYLLKGYPLEMIKMFLLLGEPSCPLQLPRATFRLDIDKTLVSAARGARLRVSGRSPLGRGQRGVIALYSPKDEEVSSATIRFSPDGRFERVFELRPSDEAGTWTVRAYCWNERARRDALGWAQVVVARPEVLLRSLAREKPMAAVRSGQVTTFTCVVANRSPLRARPVSVRLYRVQGKRRFRVGQTDLALGANEERTVRFSWKAEPGVWRFEAVLSGPPEVIGKPSPSERRKVLDLAVVSDGTGSRLALASEPVKVRFAGMGRSCMRRTEVRLASIGSDPAEQVEITLADETGTSLTRKVGKLAPGEIKTVLFQQRLDKVVLPRRYRIAVAYRANPSSETVRLEETLAVRHEEFPDLVILPDRIRFFDEANFLVFGDPTPTDGHTVYIDVAVKNIGGATAEGPFRVEAFEGDPRRGGKRLRTEVDPSKRMEIEFLEPGRVATVRFRWDPFHNAGERHIYFRVDGDQRVTESNELNNVTSRTIKVLTKGKLATGKIKALIPTYEQAVKGIRPLAATVMNDGETTLRLVLVEYFIGPNLTPENKIGEVLVDHIAPKSKIEAVLEWKSTRAERLRAAREKFGFLARQKGSTRRVTTLPE